MPLQCLKLGEGRFLSSPFQFIINQAIIWCHAAQDTGSGVK
jgi:hypothetical protein